VDLVHHLVDLVHHLEDHLVDLVHHLVDRLEDLPLRWEDRQEDLVHHLEDLPLHLEDHLVDHRLEDLHLVDHLMEVRQMEEFPQEDHSEGLYLHSLELHPQPYWGLQLMEDLLLHFLFLQLCQT
jgi:hypothetical protein